MGQGITTVYANKQPLHHGLRRSQVLDGTWLLLGHTGTVG